MIGDNSGHPFVAVVTGSNKGIGYEIARKLCHMIWHSNENHEGAVYVCSRNIERGRDAVNKLREEYKNIPRLLQLDVTHNESVTRAANIIKQEQHHIDALVLNAGFAFKQAAPEPNSVQFPETFNVNYYGVRNCMDAFMPLVGPYGRVVVVASGAGYLAWEKTQQKNKERFLQANSTQDLDAIATEMIELAKKGDIDASGWASTAYGNSKLLVTKLTEIAANSAQKEHPHLLVNSCCPGWCKTDMAGHEKPPKTAEEGAETPFMLSILPRQSAVTGKFYREGKDATYLKA
eukprot:Gregarina_sp_Pseudo_9__1949@NODE_2341_length_1033_cov_1102_729376_g2156_i0_p1_GENE_NODE_2341_length_1033_cov_1102_729376_g2156_i0NODE_2341_length_1033_cov_1102_729376_g2156_i0_p1_ORF_typecomplete_len319_score25_47adh_short/PF00106_25/2_5e37adh_short_C2/PF13561_6/1_1e25KR/PF08659_10/3e09Epimerase/PF01370_21/3e05ATPgrasp_N/PF18130_1/19ATPgrasp_N/PF18130_1/5_3_NODE_2341_length_1033_cov_1102_729376_g2156_i076945